jgi:hypothetical protein
MFKPYDLVLVRQEDYTHTGQVISKETPDKTIMVRMVPDDPSTMEEVPVFSISKPLHKDKWVHYAKVRGPGSFPWDMMRYDYAAPVSFERTEEGIALKEGQTELIIASCTETKKHRWTAARWASFGWSIEPMQTLRIEGR